MNDILQIHLSKKSISYACLTSSLDELWRHSQTGLHPSRGSVSSVRLSRPSSNVYDPVGFFPRLARLTVSRHRPHRYMMGLTFPFICSSSFRLRLMTELLSPFASLLRQHHSRKCHTKLCLYFVACSTCQWNVQRQSLGLLSCYLIILCKLFILFWWIKTGLRLHCKHCKYAITCHNRTGISPVLTAWVPSRHVIRHLVAPLLQLIRNLKQAVYHIVAPVMTTRETCPAMAFRHLNQLLSILHSTNTSWK